MPYPLGCYTAMAGSCGELPSLIGSSANLLLLNVYSGLNSVWRALCTLLTSLDANGWNTIASNLDTISSVWQSRSDEASYPAAMYAAPTPSVFQCGTMCSPPLWVPMLGTNMPGCFLQGPVSLPVVQVH